MSKLICICILFFIFYPASGQTLSNNSFDSIAKLYPPKIFYVGGNKVEELSFLDSVFILDEFGRGNGDEGYEATKGEIYRIVYRINGHIIPQESTDNTGEYNEAISSFDTIFIIKNKYLAVITVDAYMPGHSGQCGAAESFYYSLRIYDEKTLEPKSDELLIENRTCPGLDVQINGASNDTIFENTQMDSFFNKDNRLCCVLMTCADEVSEAQSDKCTEIIPVTFIENKGYIYFHLDKKKP